MPKFALCFFRFRGSKQLAKTIAVFSRDKVQLIKNINNRQKRVWCYMHMTPSACMEWSLPEYALSSDIVACTYVLLPKSTFGRVRRFGCLDLRPNLRSSVNSAFGRSLKNCLHKVINGSCQAQLCSIFISLLRIPRSAFHFFQMFARITANMWVSLCRKQQAR